MRPPRRTGDSDEQVYDWNPRRESAPELVDATAGVLAFEGKRALVEGALEAAADLRLPAIDLGRGWPALEAARWALCRAFRPFVLVRPSRDPAWVGGLLQLVEEGLKAELVIPGPPHRCAFDVRLLRKRGVRVLLEASSEGGPLPLVSETKRAIAEFAVDGLVMTDVDPGRTPDEVRALVRGIRAFMNSGGPSRLCLDWKGGNAHGLGVASALAAADGGADRLHGTWMAVGQPGAHAPLEQLMLNLHLSAAEPRDLSGLVRHCERIAELYGLVIPPNLPILGRDAFRTTTGVHAAAIAKALDRGDSDLADRVYSGVPAGSLGRIQVIDIGPMSGLSNVRFWLRAHDVAGTPELAEAILRRAKAASRTLRADEVWALVEQYGRGFTP